jgi:hypothetical protein
MSGILQVLLMAGNAPPLDAYTANLWSAYGLVKLRTGYAGSAIRVRRSSDNTEADIGFSGNALDTAALLAHVTGSLHGYVTKWYDQSGNARDWEQSTAGRQPIIVMSGEVLDAVLSMGAVYGMLTASNVASGSTFTAFLLAEQHASTTAGSLFEISDGLLNSGAQMRCTIDASGASTTLTVASGVSVRHRAYNGVVPSAAVAFAARIDTQDGTRATSLDEFLDGVEQTESSGGDYVSGFNLDANPLRMGVGSGARGPLASYFAFALYTDEKSTGDIGTISSALLAAATPAATDFPSNVAVGKFFSANPQYGLTESSGDFADGSGNATTGTVTGTITRSAGAIFTNTDGGCTFVAANSAHVNHTNANGNASAFINFSVRLVIEVASLASVVYLWGQGVAVGNDRIRIETDGSITWTHLQGNSASHTQTAAAGTVVAGTPVDLSFVWDNAAGRLWIYKNGVNVAVTNHSGTLASTSTRLNAEGIFIGRNSDGYGDFTLDEYAYSTTVWSAQQVEFMNRCLGAAL